MARSRKLPITGKRSARPAGKPGDFLIAKESLQRSLPRHFLLSASNHTERSVCVFKAWRNLSVRCWSEQKPNPGGGDRPPPDGRPCGPGKRTRREDHALLIVRDEFRTRLFLDRVARQQSPSPLHRYRQNKTMDGAEETNYHRTVSASFPPCLTEGVHPTYPRSSAFIGGSICSAGTERSAPRRSGTVSDLEFFAV